MIDALKLKSEKGLACPLKHALPVDRGEVKPVERAKPSLKREAPHL